MTESTHPIQVELPEECAMVTSHLVVVAYIREDGSSGYIVETKGDMPMTQYLGLTVLAQQEIIDW
jgi:hypothetical protein